MSNPSFSDTREPTTSSIREEITQTRDSLALTLKEIQARIESNDLREQVKADLAIVEDRAKLLITEKMAEAKVLLREEMGALEVKAKQHLAEAAESLKHGALEVKDHIKEDIKVAITDAKRSLRAATVGRVEALATTIGEKMNDTKVTVIDTVRANPIPVALIGAGIVWMLINRSRSASKRTSGRGYYPNRELGSDVDVDISGSTERADGFIQQQERKVAKVAHQAADAATHAIHSAQNTVGTAVHNFTDAAGRMATQAQTQVKTLAQNASTTASRVATQAGQVYDKAATGARKGVARVNQGYNTTLQENPLVLAGAALAIGALIGFALPRTRREDELLGPTRDQLLRKAGQSVQDAASSLASAAQDAMENVQRTKEPARA